MENYTAELEQAFAAYRREIADYERKSRPTDGLLGFGRSLGNDACHDHLDARIEKIVQQACDAGVAPQEAEALVRALLLPKPTAPWPVAAQWMLRAAERHSIPLIPLLSGEAAAAICREYAVRYRPWDRLPAQKQVLHALSQARGAAAPGTHGKD